MATTSTPLLGDSNGVSLSCCLCFGFVFANAMVLGLNLGIPNPMVVSVTETMGLNSWDVGSIVAVGPVFSAVAGLVAGSFADSFGRWKLTAVAVVLSVTGSIVLALAETFEMLLFGRLIHGLSFGTQMVSISLYTTEAAPTRFRGRAGTVTEIFINVGILAAVVGAYALSQGLKLSADSDWRVLLWISAGLATLLFPSLLVLPETPRWLAAQEHWAEAESTLYKLISDDKEVQSILAQLREAPPKEVQDISMCQMFSALFCMNPHLRMPMVRAQGTAFFHHATGIVVASMFSTILLMEHYSKDTAQVGTVIIFGFKLVAIIVSTVLVDSAGRRPLLLVSSLLMGAGYVMWATTLGISFAWTAAAVVLVNVGFSVGLGPLNYVIPGEVLPLVVRAWGVSMANVTCRTMEALISLTALPAIDAFGLFPVLMTLAGTCVISMIFFWVALPEAKQMTVEMSSKQAQA